MSEDVNKPLSWRDVYDAVHQSQDTIIKHIDDVVSPLQTNQADHEARLRTLEQGMTPWQVSMEAYIKANTAKALINEDAINSFRDREGGIVATFRGAQGFILVLLPALATIISIAAFLHGSGTDVTVSGP